MKIKLITTIALLFVFSLSVVHEFSSFLHEHSSEHVLVLHDEVNHAVDDIEHCDIHCEYHQPFVLSTNLFLTKIEYFPKTQNIQKETYTFKTNLEFYKPPIT